MTNEPEFFTGVSVRDDAAHWDALAERITAATLNETRADGAARFGRSRAAWIAAAILLIVSLAYAAAPERASAGAATDWTQAFAPADDVGRAMTASSAPPAVGALVIAETGRTR